ncbi:LPXTG cell wall anchor domain-containing protein, partial [Nocardiopsis halotolerans]|uniref:LPXTG cell wall anchor domain-containing protein n=1 Tax=Nocardiopsis halotolerans TaxID=124252 RepID=UPI000594146B
GDGGGDGDQIQAPGGTNPDTNPGDDAPEAAAPVSGDGGGDDEETLPTTGADMQGFVLGGTIVTGIGALALWASARRPAPIA